MALITILFALFIEHFLGTLEELRRFGWFATFTDWLRARLPAAGDGPLGVLLVVGLPVAAVALVGHGLAEAWSLLGFLFALLVLVYTFGPRDLEAEVEAYADARERGDDQSARWYAASLLDGNVPEEPRQRTSAIIETILVEAHERVLGIVFWFVVLGPLGAVLYRLSRELDSRYADADSGFGLAGWRLHQILAWLPTRLCAFSYALAGSFNDASRRWRDEALRWSDENRGVLVSAGFGALRYRRDAVVSAEGEGQSETDDIRDTLAMVRRAALIWLSILALFTLAGWHG